MELEIGQIHVYRVNELGIERISEGVGVHSAVRWVLCRWWSRPFPRSPAPPRGSYGKRLFRRGFAQEPVLTARVTLTEGGARRIPCAVLLPSDYQESDGPLPVLLDPQTGGRHGRRVVAADTRT
ncbi:Dipeptidyl-peptidase-4 OS=Streptomyces violarus OX=67380 GN=FHS41_002442 PE=4 SV=1 [Streptomyces violarus]